MSKKRKCPDCPGDIEEDRGSPAPSAARGLRPGSQRGGTMKNEGDASAPGERSPLLFQGPDSPRSGPPPLIRTHPPAAESGLGCPDGLA